MGSSPSQPQTPHSTGTPSTQASRLTESEKTYAKASRRATKDYKHESDEFHSICMSVFSKADANGDGQLNRQEFYNGSQAPMSSSHAHAQPVLMSTSLGLNLSEPEVQEVYKMADRNQDGIISYKEFVPVIKKILKMVYKNSTVDWNDWCKVCEAEAPYLSSKHASQVGKAASGKPLYLNKRTGEVTASRPSNFNSERKELHTFEYITLGDGTEVTSYVDSDGQRYYLNWENEV